MDRSRKRLGFFIGIAFWLGCYADTEEDKTQKARLPPGLSHIVWLPIR